MSISAQPYTLSDLKSLKTMFDALGLSGRPDIQAQTETNSGLQDAENFDFKPGEKSLKARILTLIDNNRPNIALDLMQDTMQNDRDLFDALYFDIKEALEDQGYDQDAKELDQMAAAPAIERQAIDYSLVHSKLAFG